MARHALGLRVAVPLDALRWFIANTPPSKRAPTDITITPRPPAVHVGATLDLMDTTVRASAAITVEELRIEPAELRISLRLAEVELHLVGDSNTPVAGLIKSGALDLSKPGNLANFMPKKPPVLVEAKGDRVVLDLMKNPKIRANDKLHKVLATLTPVVGVSALRTEGDYLLVALKATPMGFAQAVNAARALYP
ncbi:hypothetical protein [Haliangium sp.]|uniref:hypothetical protein n=1 Tax=Haliangium sp. TaxID=2663208 RepID=UPI003D12A6E1